MTLKEFRNKKRYTQQQMANEIGVSFSTYQKVEQGSRNPTFEFMKRLKSRFKSFDINIFFK